MTDEWRIRADLVKALSDFFLSEGWEVFDHLALTYDFNPEGDDLEVSVDLDDLATHLIREGYRK